MEQKVQAIPEKLKLMQEYDIINSVDLLRGELPAYKSDILYSRLFGKGEKNIYQPTDQELKSIYKPKLVNSRKLCSVFIVNACIKMLEDSKSINKLENSQMLQTQSDYLH